MEVADSIDTINLSETISTACVDGRVIVERQGICKL